MYMSVSTCFQLTSGSTIFWTSLSFSFSFSWDQHNKTVFAVTRLVLAHKAGLHYYFTELLKQLK